MGDYHDIKADKKPRMKSAILNTDHISRKSSKVAFEDSPKSVVMLPDGNPEGIFYRPSRQSNTQTGFQSYRKSNAIISQMKLPSSQSSSPALLKQATVETYGNTEFQERLESARRPTTAKPQTKKMTVRQTWREKDLVK